ncbi:MAG TPA: S1/P1 nuclease [Pseudomonadales bacterium]|nr:S1/P1 nuclease [Pseudomonadales bacterium]
MSGLQGPACRHFTVVLLVLALLPALASAWGPTGHRVTGALAEHWLSPRAAAAVAGILGAETLAEVSTWPDQMRSSPEPFWQRTATPWHWVTVPPGRTYVEVGAPPEGDAYTALARFRGVLRDPDASLEERQLALRFAVHLVGDLHQPLHVGNGSDRGGNQFEVRYMGDETNLHSVWDSGIINRQELSFSEWTQRLLRHVDAESLAAWSEPDPLVWIAESAAIRPTIYPQTRAIGWDYDFVSVPVIRTRLSQAGVRLAAWLNETFEE